MTEQKKTSNGLHNARKILADAKTGVVRASSQTKNTIGALETLVRKREAYKGIANGLNGGRDYIYLTVTAYRARFGLVDNQ